MLMLREQKKVIWYQGYFTYFIANYFRCEINREYSPLYKSKLLLFGIWQKVFQKDTIKMSNCWHLLAKESKDRDYPKIYISEYL